RYLDISSKTANKGTTQRAGQKDNLTPASHGVTRPISQKWNARAVRPHLGMRGGRGGWVGLPSDIPTSSLRRKHYRTLVPTRGARPALLGLPYPRVMTSVHSRSCSL